MKLSEVQVGGVYDTKVSGAWVKVRVTSQVEYLRPNHVMGEKVRLLVRFRVARVDNGKPLPNSRPASALHYDGAAVTRRFHLGGVSHQSSDGSVIPGLPSATCGCQSCRGAVHLVEVGQ